MTERNIKLVVEYDGTDFHGWQRQPGRRTVQGEIEEAARRLTGEEIDIIGAGRTDAGVHAVGQVCNFKTTSDLAPERFQAALSALLPDDVHIRTADIAAPAFHARFDAIRRRYVYHVRTGSTALYRRYVHVVTHRLDIDLMRAAARSFPGRHDFSPFATSMDAQRSTVCRVMRVEIRQTGALISFHIDADRFLRKMVRLMVGTLLETGRGKIGVERIGSILRTRDKAAAGPAVPPQGLFLTEVVYH